MFSVWWKSLTKFSGPDGFHTMYSVTVLLLTSSDLILLLQINSNYYYFLFFLESILDNCVYVCVFGCEVLGEGGINASKLKCIYLKLFVCLSSFKILSCISIVTSSSKIVFLIFSVCFLDQSSENFFSVYESSQITQYKSCWSPLFCVHYHIFFYLCIFSFIYYLVIFCLFYIPIWLFVYS